MGQKVHPIGFRLGGVYTWSSRWFATRQSYRDALRQDVLVRQFLRKKYRDANVAKIDIERSANTMAINIFTAKPGVIIGRGGQGVSGLRKELVAQFLGGRTSLVLNILEVETPSLSAALAVQAIVADIEKRIPFRRAMRQALARFVKAGAEGAKIMVSGRLDGSEIARREKMAVGKIPMHTLRANIDYSRAAAHTTYGAVGVKVWVYRGEVFAAASAAAAADRPDAAASRRLRPRADR